ncbi:MAG TPA: carboxypeptidase-like regulatory domain-containing protein, partial [Planctomycetota bacterium]
MPRRSLLVGALALVAALALLLRFVTQPPPAGPAPPIEAAGETEPLDPVAFEGALPPIEIEPRDREEIAPGGGAPIELLDSQGAEQPSDAAVTRVRVTVAFPEGTAATPFPYPGQPVTVQTWNDTTRAVQRHDSALDAKGLAEFRFRGEVHVDWARFSPPEDSGLGLGLYEGHDDVAPGGLYEIEIELDVALALHGRVVDLEGRAVAGAVVHLYSDGQTDARLDARWTPGVLQTATAVDGAFSFPRLREGGFGVAVEPLEWLQLD